MEIIVFLDSTYLAISGLDSLLSLSHFSFFSMSFLRLAISFPSSLWSNAEVSIFSSIFSSSSRSFNFFHSGSRLTIPPFLESNSIDSLTSDNLDLATACEESLSVFISATISFALLWDSTALLTRGERASSSASRFLITFGSCSSNAFHRASKPFASSSGFTSSNCWTSIVFGSSRDRRLKVTM